LTGPPETYAQADDEGSFSEASDIWGRTVACFAAPLAGHIQEVPPVLGVLFAEAGQAVDLSEDVRSRLADLAGDVGRVLANVHLLVDMARHRALFEQAYIVEQSRNAAHDIRNELASAGWQLRRLEQLAAREGREVEECKACLREVWESFRFIDATVEGLRRDPFVLERVPVDLNGIIVDLARDLRAHTARDSVAVQLDLWSGVLECLIDRARMMRAFKNLALNALDAMPNGGALRIRSAVSSVEGMAEVEFRDGGSGMSDDALRRFAQGFGVPSSKHDRIGIGLMCAKAVVEHDHAGQVEIESEVGRGTTVRVRVPYQVCIPAAHK